MTFQFYNPQEKTFLGRTSISWIKITLFYAIYYTFLGVLIYFSVGFYSDGLPKVGNSKPKISTRTDQPGTGVYPLNLIDYSIDKESELYLDENDMFKKGSSTNEYLMKFLKFADMYKNVEGKTTESCKANYVDGKKNESKEQRYCEVENAKFLTNETIQSWVEKREPVVALSLNKVYNWTPLNNKLNSEVLKSDDIKFYKDSVYVNCYETNVKGEAIEKSYFEIDYLKDSEKNIGRGYFPYLGMDKFAEDDAKFLPYNKPFVLVQIKSKKATENELNAWDKTQTESKKPGPFYFSCYWYADNLNRPVKVEDWKARGPTVKWWSVQLQKDSLGISKFSLYFPKSESSGKVAQNLKTKSDEKVKTTEKPKPTPKPTVNATTKKATTVKPVTEKITEIEN